jgi:integrase
MVWACSDLNRGPRDYESPALTAELQALLQSKSDDFHHFRIAFFTALFYGHGMKRDDSQKTWKRTSVQNLVRHRSGRYYARIYAHGKESWKSLKTDLLEVAKAKLREFTGEVEETVRAAVAEDRGRMTVGDCIVLFRAKLQSGFGLRGRGKMLRKITPSSIHYREQTILALIASWPGLEKLDVRKINQADIEEWAQKFSAKYSATRYNNTLDTLRALIRIAMEAGARHGNPADKVGRIEVKAKNLVLPEREQFKSFVAEIRGAGAWCSNDCSDFVEFLAYTGARKNEAANVTWADIDFQRGRVHLRITKGGQQRYVPMIADAQTLLRRMRDSRPKESANYAVLQVREAQKAMDAAAKKIGIQRITHHDLRHLFATACIEAGVDIPTVSRWLGHRDGGALAMRTYGHLRDEHSQTQAQKVSFSPAINAA